MAKTWSSQTVRYLTQWAACPRCDTTLDRPGFCSNCDADLTTPIASQLRDVSERAAELIASRQALIESLTDYGYSAKLKRAPATPTRPSTVGAAPAASNSGSQVSVQSVLAIAGAALFAIAAIVFTFLNPDLTNFDTRTAIVGAITVVFLGGAWFLARAKLQFSAEAVGALGMVFVGLDVWAFSTSAVPNVSGWVFGGIGTFAVSVLMVAFASIARIRTWLWIALVGIAVTPAFFGYAVGGTWAATVGHLGVAVVALAVHELIRKLSSRFESPLAADHATATAVQIAIGVIVLGQLVASPSFLQSSAVIGVLAITAALSTRNQLPAFWSVIAGALFVTAIGILPFALHLGDGNWLITLVPLAGSVAIVALGCLALVDSRRHSTTLSRAHLLIGGWIVALASVIPALYFAIGQIASPLHSSLPAAFGGPSILGLVAASAGALGLSMIVHRLATSPFTRSDATLVGTTLSVALWGALLAILATSTWPVLPGSVRVSIGIGVALALSALVARVRRADSLAPSIRMPLIIGAHLSLLLAAVVSWATPTLSMVGGAAAVLTVVAVAHTIPAKFRPAHAAVGFAYALVVIAHALTLAHLETIAVLCLTTSVASVFALGVTLLRRLSAGFWYAILGVTLVPFLIGIVSVLFARSGWTALSTGVTFALALTLVITRRPGMSRYLRSFAAALLVPALAVVVVCLGAQVLIVSASPITLPIIAVIVACVLPSTGLIGASLRRLKLSAPDVRASTLWIEISALVTGALAVVLSLVRAAAGLDTSFVVLLIIGLGAAVTGLTTKRRYAWAVAGASWTGALWCFWSLIGVRVLEPYLLPPALAAAVVGAISVARKLPGLGLYSIGLVSAVVPSLVVLAGWGNGIAGPGWRVAGLLAGAVVLVAIGAILTRHSDRPVLKRLGVLRGPTLLVALLAASAGTIQAARLGWSFDSIDARPIMVAALAFSIGSAVISAAAAAMILRVGRSGEPAAITRLRTSRWLYSPAVIYLALGPIAAVRADWFSVWVLWLLTAVLLGIMLAIVVRGRTRTLSLPPVWFMFAVAWATAVAGWSERMLRVEAFSLLLGLALLAAGILAMRRRELLVRRSFTSWPAAHNGSWRLLTPGIIVTFLPSLLATGTDPQTARAILVIALALTAILVGSLRKLGAPFILGIIVLPLENITVFAVQVGRSIGAAPWWITLATAGAVLLVVSVTYERRDAGNRGVAARLRDLR